MVSRPGMAAASASSEPSGPVVGPEMSWTSRPGFWRRPRMVARVFSCAPPMTSRVMICVTRMASFPAQLRQAVKDGAVFGRVGRRIGQIDLEIADGLVGVLLAGGDLAQSVGDLK